MQLAINSGFLAIFHSLQNAVAMIYLFFYLAIHLFIYFSVDVVVSANANDEGDTVYGRRTRSTTAFLLRHGTTVVLVVVHRNTRRVL